MGLQFEKRIHFVSSLYEPAVRRGLDSESITEKRDVSSENSAAISVRRCLLFVVANSRTSSSSINESSSKLESLVADIISKLGLRVGETSSQTVAIAYLEQQTCHSHESRFLEDSEKRIGTLGRDSAVNKRALTGTEEGAS